MALAAFALIAAADAAAFLAAGILLLLLAAVARFADRAVLRSAEAEAALPVVPVGFHLGHSKSPLPSPEEQGGALGCSAGSALIALIQISRPERRG
jgi:hypothetical protein